VLFFANQEVTPFSFFHNSRDGSLLKNENPSEISRVLDLFHTHKAKKMVFPGFFIPPDGANYGGQALSTVWGVPPLHELAVSKGHHRSGSLGRGGPTPRRRWLSVSPKVFRL
jgi:hypothetical protein